MKCKKSSSSKLKNGEQETENLENLEKPHLNPVENQNISNEQENPDGLREEQEKAHFPHRRKQVRRRVQTRKPYPENHLNMAEARREIVAALKLHRAAMKQAREKQHQRPEMDSGPEQEKLGPETHQFSSEQLKSRRNTRNYASDYSTCNRFISSVNNTNAYSPGFYSRPVSPFAPPLPVREDLNFVVLPSKTLGLSLNLDDFNNLYSSSSPSTSSTATAGEEIPYVGGAPTTTAAGAVRSVEVKNEIGWDDGSGFESSVGRAEFMEPVEIGPNQDSRSEDFAGSPFDEVMEFPAWMSADERCLQQHVSDFYSGDYSQDPALPCMDIEEIEGMDGDWLA